MLVVVGAALAGGHPSRDGHLGLYRIHSAELVPERGAAFEGNDWAWGGRGVLDPTDTVQRHIETRDNLCVNEFGVVDYCAQALFRSHKFVLDDDQVTVIHHPLPSLAQSVKVALPAMGDVALAIEPSVEFTAMPNDFKYHWEGVPWGVRVLASRSWDRVHAHANAGYRHEPREDLRAALLEAGWDPGPVPDERVGAHPTPLDVALGIRGGDQVPAGVGVEVRSRWVHGFAELGGDWELGLPFRQSPQRLTLGMRGLPAPPLSIDLVADISVAERAAGTLVDPPWAACVAVGYVFAAR